MSCHNLGERHNQPYRVSGLPLSNSPLYPTEHQNPNSKTPFLRKHPRKGNGSTPYTLEECWGLPKPVLEDKNEFPTFFGHSQDNKIGGSFRCITHNINNIPQKSFWPKSRIITKMAQGYDNADIRLWQEVGLYWPKVEFMDTWRNRIKSKGHGISSQFAFNALEHDITGIIQPGGTAIISNLRLTSRKINAGKDPHNLGRWVWTTYGVEGKLKTTFISVYRPCIATSGGGTATYDQHRRHLRASQEPREQLLVDLTLEVESFQEKGHNIIIGMDANEDIYGKRILKFMDSLNLHDALASIHGNICPSTTTKSLKAKPIDILMCSIHFKPRAAGIDFSIGSPSDHAVVWADFDKSDLFGEDFREFKTHVSHLNADDPRHTQRYNDLVWKKLSEEGIPKKLNLLNEIPLNHFTFENTQSYNEILVRTTQIRKSVSKSLRRVFRGQKEWSPDWDMAKKTKALWFLIDKKQHC